VDAKPEVNAAAFVFERQESVIATLTSDNNYSGIGRTATVTILDGNPIALQQLDNDITLYYGLSKSSALSGGYGDSNMWSISGNIVDANDPSITCDIWSDTLGETV